MVPTAIVTRAKSAGIEMIAICDHNSGENALAVARAGERESISVVPGMEITTREEVHILASASRRLQNALAEGAGLDETYPTYRKLLVTARRAAQELRRVEFGESVSELGERIGGKVDAVADAIRRIRPFYEAEPPL